MWEAVDVVLEIDKKGKQMQKAFVHGVGYNGGHFWAVLFWLAFAGIIYATVNGAFKDATAWIVVGTVFAGMIAAFLTYVSIFYPLKLKEGLNALRAQLQAAYESEKKKLSEENEEVRKRLATERENALKRHNAKMDLIAKAFGRSRLAFEGLAFKLNHSGAWEKLGGREPAEMRQFIREFTSIREALGLSPHIYPVGNADRPASEEGTDA